MIQTQTRKNAFTRHQKVKHIFLFCHNFKTYVQKWVSITFNTSMYNKPRANYKGEKFSILQALFTAEASSSYAKRTSLRWAGVKGLLLWVEGGQLKARHTATSVSHVGWAGVKRLLLRADGGQFWCGTNISRASHISILANLMEG